MARWPCLRQEAHVFQVSRQRIALTFITGFALGAVGCSSDTPEIPASGTTATAATPSGDSSAPSAAPMASNNGAPGTDGPPSTSQEPSGTPPGNMTGEQPTPDPVPPPGDVTVAMPVDPCTMPDRQVVDPALLPSCDLCDKARCVPNGLVPEEQRDLLAACDDDNLCVPDSLVAGGGTFLLKSCRSVSDTEGRCVSKCLPQVASQLDRLPVDTCADDEVCAPCFDPLTGEATGACGLSCDPGPEEPPKVYAGCCGDLGTCVPGELVPEAARPLLGALDCAAEGALCAPTNQVIDPTFVPASCRAVAGAEGRCLAGCLPPVAERADQLTISTCEPGELCVPCYDPVTGVSTGACEQGMDAPLEAPALFERCCGDGSESGDLGLCVPGDLVPEAQQPLLGTDSCGGEGNVCAPRDVVAGSYAPDRCGSWLDAEGRCLPACLPPVAAQAARLTQDVCGDGKLCTPCFDPLTGLETGACSLEGDSPQVEPPVVFPKCCNTGGKDRGTCVPKVLAGNQADVAPRLDCDSSTGTADEYVCAPDEKVADLSYKFPSCTTKASCGLNPICLLAGLSRQRGACLPACMLAEQASVAGIKPATTYQRGDDCQEGEICAPCNLPFLAGGGSTGACD